MSEFPSALRAHRRQRRLSQLDLAGEAGVSPRHLAFQETARARRSRDMVLRLARALGLGPGAVNALMQAAGFAAAHPARALDDAAMAQVRAAMEWTIARHAPYPALVMDADWRIVMLNAPAGVLAGVLGFGPGDSLLALCRDPQRFQSLVENWAEVDWHMAARLSMESARAGGRTVLDQTAAALRALPQIARFSPETGRVVIPTVFRIGDQRLSLFSTYASFGTAEEVALADMKIELMFPADEASRHLLLSLAPG